VVVLNHEIECIFINKGRRRFLTFSNAHPLEINIFFIAVKANPTLLD
jgi:hypothetical protein